MVRTAPYKYSRISKVPVRQGMPCGLNLHEGEPNPRMVVVGNVLYERQRPGTRASGGCPMALTIGSQPSRSLGSGARGVWLFAGPLTALRRLGVVCGRRSLLRVRLTVAIPWSTDVAAVVVDTSSPARKHAKAKAAPEQARKYRE
ncbi:MAG TPA: hypothetical protein VIH98_09210 [Xanthobacteraceae bacterium]|jgi:hypothetical protein